MKSITKYISLLTIALLAVSAFGVCSAKEIFLPGEDRTLNYTFGEPAFASTQDIDILNTIFTKNNLSASDYFSVSTPYAPYENSSFVKFTKQVVPLTTTVSVFDHFDNSTKDVYFVNNKYTLIVLPGAE